MVAVQEDSVDSTRTYLIRYLVRQLSVMSAIKNPPAFCPEEGDDYGNWKKDAEVWRLFTSEAKCKQGAALYLSLKGTARDAVRGISADVLKEDNGFDEVIKVLDTVYQKDTATQAYCAFKDFVEYRRSSGDNFSVFIVKFEKRYRDVEKHDMQLPTGVKAYFLLQAANLTIDNERLARTTAKLDYDDMKNQIQKVFGESVGNGDETLPIKTEECNYTRGRFTRGRGGRRTRPFIRRGNDRNGQIGSTSRRVEFSDTNPVGFGGDVMRCHNCESTKHFVDTCPHRTTEEANMTVHITLVAGKGEAEQCYLMAESVGYGILDSACTKTVAGENWINEYISTLTEEESVDIKRNERKSNSMYRFGDGVESRSLKMLNLPVIIGNRKLFIEVDVVTNNIPLLISKPTMTKLGVKIDFASHEAVINGQIMKLCCTSSGHYSLPISRFTSEDCKVVFNDERLLGNTTEEKKKKAIKLHRQMCHASKDRLQRLLRNGGCKDREFLKLIETCCENCEFCRKYKKPFYRPVVGFPVAEHFNQVVCIDLKELEKGKLWFLHMVDAATRYTAACIIHTKKKEEVVCRIFQLWIAYFGTPKKFHSDCGGEFCNDVFREMNEKLGIETSTTPGESPFSNGIVERNNKILYESMMKTMEESKCDRETALAWSVSASNALQNVTGFAPNQLVLGANINLPSVITDQPPALEPTTSSELIRKKLAVLHNARQNFIKAESSEKIKRALSHQVRTYSEEWYEPGEKVYYRRRFTKGWRGPAKVLGKEGNFVLIRHGNVFYRCHPCHIMKVNPTGGDDSNANSSAINTATEVQGKSGGIQQKVNNDATNRSDLDNTANAEDNDTENETEEEEIIDFDEEDLENESHLEQEVTERLNNNSTRPKSKTMIEYMLKDGERGQVTVLAQQPKRTGSSRNWVNVSAVGQDEDSSINWDCVEWWREKESEQVLLVCDYQDTDASVIEAKGKEIKNLEDNNVFEWVNDYGQEIVSCRWVLSEKQKDDGSSFLKARLVARGFEDYHYEGRTDSPTCSKQSLRMVFVVASTMS